MIGAETAYRCPVCRASFRSTRECSRCGVDLSRVMTILAEAQIMRKNARKAIRSGDFQLAHSLAELSQTLCTTEAGRRLVLLTAWLESG